MSCNVRLSFIVAVYNVGPFLERCLVSLLNQTESAIQVVVVIDGATDDSDAIASALAENDKRIKIIRTRNQGLSAARNSGLNAAVGDFVCFIDGDDWVEPTLACRMLSSASESNADVVIAGAIVDFHNANEELISSESRLLPSLLVSENHPLTDEVVNSNFVNLLGYAWNKIYNRSWLLSLDQKFEVGLRLIEDIDFNARVLSRANRVMFISENFVHYIQRPRLSLGSRRDPDFLILRVRALNSVDQLLKCWQIPSWLRKQIRKQNGIKSLWAALKAASQTQHSRDTLSKMVDTPVVRELMGEIRCMDHDTARERWISYTLCRGHLRTALLPFRLLKIASWMRDLY